METAPSTIRMVQLRCEYLENPRGIDATRPRLAWKAVSERRGMRQTAWQVQVAETYSALQEDSGLLWDSGKVLSDCSIQIEYDGPPLLSRQHCHWQVRIWDENDEATGWSEPAFWTMGLLTSQDWQAQWIGYSETGREKSADYPTPRYARKSFTTRLPIRRATVYATALGLYELRINGQRVWEHLLAPEWTDYRKRIQYQTYDVTHLLADGTNVLAALLGNGWYCGGWQFWQSSLKSIYDDQPFLLVQLEIEGRNRERQTIASDGSWRVTTYGPLRFSGIYEGETYDARMSLPGWDTPGFDDRTWSSALVAEPMMGQLVAHRSGPIRISQELAPINLTEPKPGVYVFDFGQNFAGWCRLHIDEALGTVITLRHNEMLNPDGTLYLENLHAGNLSEGDRQVIRYICNGEREVYEPHFTYQGFRYVEVTGLTKPPPLGLLTGCVFHTAMEQTGTFSCSNPLVNRLAENIQWSQRSNIMGIPTDCCQRDERCGYTGDMNFFMPTAVYNFDMAAFFNKWLVDLCEDSQMPDGHFADHSPTYGPGDGWNVGWSDAGIICPYLMYRTYGDTRIIRDQYAAMRRYMELQIATAKNHLRGPEGIGNGDWLNLGGGASQEVIGTAYYAFNLKLMAEMAVVAGENADAARYAELAAKAREAFVCHLIDDNGNIRESSQTGYALAFTMGLVPEDKRASMSAAFAKEIRRFDNHLATGFIGTPRLLPALHFAGLDDLASKLLVEESYPSWLFPVALGATTIWERWDGWTPDKGFADSGMNSFNHYAFGAVGEYLYRMIGGISEVAPGYKKIRIQPIFIPDLTWAKVTFDSPHGLIACHWHRANLKVHVEVTIPSNTTAEIVLPGSDEGVSPTVEKVTSGTYHCSAHDPFFIKDNSAPLRGFEPGCWG